MCKKFCEILLHKFFIDVLSCNVAFSERERTPPKNPEHVNETREHLAACSVEYCKPSAATLLAKLS